MMLKKLTALSAGLMVSLATWAAPTVEITTSLQTMLDIGNVLTPEQRTILAEQMRQRQGMMQHRMGPKGDPRS